MNENLSSKALYDLQLIDRALQHDDQKAYAELMERYYDSVYFMVLKMINNRLEAEDLTIEAFGKAFSCLSLYTSSYAFSTWLFRIASNNCIDYIRKRKMQSFSIDQTLASDDKDSTPTEFQSETDSPEETYIRKQKASILRNYIKLLKPHQKEVLELRYFQELSYEEMAQKLAIPIGTVKAQLFRAKEALNSIIKNENI